MFEVVSYEKIINDVMTNLNIQNHVYNTSAKQISNNLIFITISTFTYSIAISY